MVHIKKNEIMLLSGKLEITGNHHAEQKEPSSGR
jgi:hypothetical protein